MEPLEFMERLTDLVPPIRPNTPQFYDRHIIKPMHFYHNIVFIKKGFNNERPFLLSQKVTGISFVRESIMS
jgi:hypothetical protein